MTGRYDVIFRSAKPMLGYGTTEIRCVQPMQFLRATGLSADAGSIYENGLPPCRVLVLHRVPLDAVTQRAIHLARAYGAAIVYDTDDFISTSDGRDWDPGIAAAMRAVDLVSVSGPALAERVAKLSLETVTMRAKLSDMLLETARRAASTERPSDKVVLGYFSGSAHHDADFDLVAPQLAQVLKEFPETHLALGGKLSVGSELAEFGARVSFAPFRPYAEFVALLGGIDINLAPLDLTSSLAQCRSDLKFIEAAAFGVPTVASPSPAYCASLEDGVSGFIAQDDEWYAKLAHLVGEPTLRVSMGAAARDYVMREASPEAGQAEWRALFDRMCPPPAETRLLAALPAQLGLRIAQARRGGRRQLKGMLQDLPFPRARARH
ncbi:MAG: glycosyltransferase [Pseudomonadota bacterium]